MNKIKSFAVLGLAVATLAVIPQRATAVEFRSFDLLNVSAVVVTNTYAITNFLAPLSLATNQLGTTYTNNRTRVIASASNGGTTQNLLGRAPLYPLANGQPAFASGTNGIGDVYLAAPGYANISVTLSGGAAADQPCTFVAIPCWDGINPDTSGTANFTFGVTPNTTSTVTFSTNCPTRKWIGAGAIMLARIVPGDTDANGQLIITDVKLNQWVPDGAP